ARQHRSQLVTAVLHRRRTVRFYRHYLINNNAMTRGFAIVLAVCGLAAVTLPETAAQALPPQYDSSALTSDSRSNWDALGGLYALLAQHDALGGHALARKSVRSPSRRLRFGRRSDPDMPPQAPLDEMEELLSLRESRTPVRLRFGRRSDERAVPHVFPQGRLGAGRVRRAA
ncbi:hypothetical protein ACJJTC_008259, partial [Scirpophaga incertulas]